MDVIGAIEDEITDVALEVLHDAALHRVFEGDLHTMGIDAPGARRSVADAGAAGARVDRAFDAAQRRVGDFTPATGAGIGEAACAQLGECRGIDFAARALRDDFAVGVHAAGGERGADVLAGTGHAARRVEVFDTQQPATAVMAGIGITGHCSDQ